MEELFKIKDMNREWKTLKEYDDILFEFYNGIARITINRPQVRNAFTPRTVSEMSDALYICRERRDVRVVVLTGAGDKAFCSGGDMHVKGHGGYVGDDGVPRLNVLEVQKQIRSLPKPVIAAVNGFAIGGGHVLHVVCDLTIASDNAVFGQTGPRVGSFDAGFGSSYLARVVGQKKAREIWFLCRKYNAQEALDMAAANARRNGFEGDCAKFVCKDVFTYLRELRDAGEKFDLVILDPPKFASNHRHVERAARAYKDINLNGLKLLLPGGQLFTFSCSGAVDVDLFQKIVAGAVFDAKVDAWAVGRFGGGIDHPLLMTYPEGEYLKGLHLLVRP